MGTWNLADILGAVFLGIGVIDGYRKGLVKKGTSLVITLVTLLVVYLASPYVETFLAGILPSPLSVDRLTGSDSELYQILVLSGFKEEIESSVQILAARVLAVILTYIIVRILLRTLLLSVEILAKVPGLSLLNRLGGACFGLIQQLLGLWLLFLVIMIFSSTGWGSSLRELIRQSEWLWYLYDNNVLLLAGILLILKI